MEISQRLVLIQVASNDDVAMASARLVHADPFQVNVRPCHLDDGDRMQSPPGTEEGSAKRHHHDAPDPALGEMLATARALQKVVDGLWAQVKDRQPAVVTPSDRAYDRATERAATAQAEGWLAGHKAALEALQERVVRHSAPRRPERWQDHLPDGLAFVGDPPDDAVPLHIPPAPAWQTRVLRWLG